MPYIDFLQKEKILNICAENQPCQLQLLDESANKKQDMQTAN
jgi:hypothetical protein